MTDLISRQAAIDLYKRFQPYIAIKAVDFEKALEQLPSAQPARELIEQLRWERDTAIQQLKDLGYGLGEKPKTDDTISRQAAIEAFRKELCREREYAISFRGCERVLSKLPSVQPERKKGKWINHRNDMGHNIADCSECGEAMQWYDPDTRPHYCPNCGADMRGADNV